MSLPTQRKQAVCAAGVGVAHAPDRLRHDSCREIVRQHLGRYKHPVDVEELRKVMTTPGSDLYGLTDRQLDLALAELSSQRQATREARGKERFVRLTDHAASEVRSDRRDAEARCKRVLRDLFDFATDNNRRAFVQMIYLFFQGLAGRYVQELADGRRIDSGTQLNVLRDAIKRVTSVSSIDPTTLEAAAIKFFATRSKDFDFVKWNLSQSFFITKLLRLDPESLLLTQELFSGTMLLLDTNIVIDILEPGRDLHDDFLRLLDAANAIDITLAVSRPTLAELDRWVTTQKGYFEEMEKSGINGLEESVDGALLGRFREARSVNPKFPIDHLFQPFADAQDTLANSYGIDVLDDAVFVRSRKETQDLADLIALLSEEHRQRRKSDEAAHHDAAVLLGVREYAAAGNRIFFLTADTSLPDIGKDTKNGGRPVDFGAVLNWIAPTARQTLGDVDFADLFSELLRRQVLPVRNVLSPKRFDPVISLEQQCETLTSRDVNRLLDLLQRTALKYDPRSSRDRAELFEQMLMARSDPLARTREEAGRLHDTVVGLHGRISALKGAHWKLTETIAQLTTQNEKLRSVIQLERENRHREDQRRGAILKFASGFLLTMVVLLVILLSALRDDPSASILSAISANWPVLAFAAAVGLGATLLVLGRDVKLLPRPARVLLEREGGALEPSTTFARDESEDSEAGRP